MAHILIVDDTATEATLMAGVVHKLGHSSEVATDGEACLSLARSKKPSLILLDVVMPKMDGFNTCRKLKKDSETSAIPIVMVTSKDQETDKFWAQRQGADGYVVKPFAPSELTAAIQKFVA